MDKWTVSLFGRNYDLISIVSPVVHNADPDYPGIRCYLSAQITLSHPDGLQLTTYHYKMTIYIYT